MAPTAIPAIAPLLRPEPEDPADDEGTPEELGADAVAEDDCVCVMVVALPCEAVIMLVTTDTAVVSATDCDVDDVSEELVELVPVDFCVDGLVVDALVVIVVDALFIVVDALFVVVGALVDVDELEVVDELVVELELEFESPNGLVSSLPLDITVR